MGWTVSEQDIRCRSNRVIKRICSILRIYRPTQLIPKLKSAWVETLTGIEGLFERATNGVRNWEMAYGVPTANFKIDRREEFDGITDRLELAERIKRLRMTGQVTLLTTPNQNQNHRP